MIQTPTRISQTIPPLENGDRLSCDEFERRYVGMPNGCKAELIEGIVYMAAALRFKSHGRPHGRNVALLPDEDSITRSQIFPGLWFYRSALLAGNMKQVLAVLQLGTRSTSRLPIPSPTDSDNSLKQ